MRNSLLGGSREFSPPNNEFSSGNNRTTMETANRPDVVANRDIDQVGAAR
jgi:hypothetical protein